VGNLGVGLPEMVGVNLLRAGLLPHTITIATESGAFGGVPAMGIFFGCSVHPEKLIPSHAMFDFLEANLSVTCLGALEVDRHGNVNVSRRSVKVQGVVGSGGFPNIVRSAQTVVFVFSWLNGGLAPKIHGGKVHVAHNHERKGVTCKIVESVQEVTFNAKEALRQGKRVVYCTNVGVLRLQPSGLELIHVAPGIDVNRDIMAWAPRGSISVSPSLATIPESIVTGHGFALRLPSP
jgi:propionate CoA-transferase